MKPLFILVCIISFLLFAAYGISDNGFSGNKKSLVRFSFSERSLDTCIIEGQAFMMRDYHSKRIMRAYIKNGQLNVVNDGLQYAKFRIIQYIFSSLTYEDMPTYRAFNQRLSPPVLQILKNSRVGEQFLFEEIVVVDQSSNILANEVRPLMLERIKN